MSFSDRIEKIENEVKDDYTTRPFRMATVLGGVGALGGFLMAYRRHSGVWGYVGYGFFGALIGSTVGNVAGMATSKE